MFIVIAFIKICDCKVTLKGKVGMSCLSHNDLPKSSEFTKV